MKKMVTKKGKKDSETTPEMMKKCKKENPFMKKAGKKKK